MCRKQSENNRWTLLSLWDGNYMWTCTKWCIWSIFRLHQGFQPLCIIWTTFSLGEFSKFWCTCVFMAWDHKETAFLASSHHVDPSNQSLIYHQNDPQWFHLCLMLFLKLSHKSSRIKRMKRCFSPSPRCISSLPVCGRSYRDARSALPLDDPLRYIWCQCEQLVFLFSLRFPHLFPLPITLLISPLVWSAVALLRAGLRARGTRLMAAGERVRDTPVWAEAHQVLVSAPIHHPRALITQWWRMYRMEEERVLDDRHVFVAQQKQFSRLLWATFFSTLIYPEEVCGEKMICHSMADRTVKPSSRRNNIVWGSEVICNNCGDHQLFPLVSSVRLHAA